MSEKKQSVFDILNAIDVSDKIEKKNGLSYLSWSWAWATVKKLYPQTTYTIYENKDGLNYHHDGKTAWAKTGVKIDDVEYIEYLPIMDFRNKSIPINNLTSFDVNKTIQRSLTKSLARHGLGLYIYSGEDLPDDASSTPIKLNEEQVLELEKLIIDTKSDKSKLLAFFKVSKIDDVDYDKCKAMLLNKLNKASKTKGDEDVAKD